MSEDIPFRLGQGPEAHIIHHVLDSRDPRLREWEEWVEHDGSGVPPALIGRVVLLAGQAHDGVSSLGYDDVHVTPDYATSALAAVWDWSQGYGGVARYRLRRHAALPIDGVVLHDLDMSRYAAKLPPLLIGLDGVAE